MEERVPDNGLNESLCGDEEAKRQVSKLIEKALAPLLPDGEVGATALFPPPFDAHCEESIYDSRSRFRSNGREYVGVPREKSTRRNGSGR